VEAGRGEGKRPLRMIPAKEVNKTYSVLTKVLDPELLTAAEANRLYRRRWPVERLFSKRKQVLNLNRLYAAHPNAVAMQLFATAMVHAAFRVVQGRAAQQVELPPERLSPGKFFPRIAVPCISMVGFEFVFLEVSKAKPGLRLRKPTPSAARNQRIPLSGSWLSRGSPSAAEEGARPRGASGSRFGTYQGGEN